MNVRYEQDILVPSSKVIIIISSSDLVPSSIVRRSFPILATVVSLACSTDLVINFASSVKLSKKFEKASLNAY